MTFPITRRRWLEAASLWTVAGVAPVARAQTAPGTEAMPRLEGTDAQGRPIRLSALRGRVVLVFHWRTDCAVCRDKMHELRANLLGWQGRPFSLIGVNGDTRRQDWLDYEKLVAGTIPAAQRFPSLWAGDAATVDSTGPTHEWPSAVLFDKTARAVERYQGRIPVEAWDRIAELL